MKLEKILDQLNTLEKNSFSKILDQIINSNPKNNKAITSILNNYSDTHLKKLDSHIVSKVFELVGEEYYQYLTSSINQSVSQLDILIDILVKDGNCIMSREWLGKLYENETKSIRSKIRTLKSVFEQDDLKEVDERQREYLIYRNCVKVALDNDLENNLESKITQDEKSILNELAKNLDLSQEEVKLINYSVLGLKNMQLEDIINLLKDTGIILYSKKNLKLFIPDEFVRLLRRFRGKEVADKYQRRILNLLKDSELNLICKSHDLDKKLERKLKIKHIIKEGISLRNLLKYDIHKIGTTLTAKKSKINDLVIKGLSLDFLKGATIDQKIDSLVEYFNKIEEEDKVGISYNGYSLLLGDLKDHLPKANKIIKKEFELQAEDVLSSELLLDYNIKPRDILETLSSEELKAFCTAKGVTLRGNEVLNILASYKDSKNIELENYENIAFRNISLLKENGIRIKESELGLKFEEMTRKILTELGFNVDEQLRSTLNTAKDKIDIVLRINDQEVFIVECKSIKEKGYNKFSSVSRQLKSYKQLAEKNNFHVIKSLLIAPEFTDDFISDVDLDYELNTSLITAKTLHNLLLAFRENKKLTTLPHVLFMREVMIQEERIIKALNK